MPDFSAWAKYLKDPLVFVGFVILILALLISALFGMGLSEELKWFSLSFLSIVVIHALRLASKRRGKEVVSREETLPDGAAPIHIEQKTEGAKSPAVVSRGDVNIHYGEE